MRVPAPRPETLAVLERLLEGRDGIRRARMFGAPAFFAGERMFACVLGDGVGLKLREARVRSLADRASVGPFVGPRGRTMREWIVLRHEDPAALEDDLDLVLESLDYVSDTPGSGA